MLQRKDTDSSSVTDIEMAEVKSKSSMRVNSSSSIRSLSPPRTRPASQKGHESMAHPKQQRTSSGTFSDCGRHSNEWLFGNFSVSGAVKGLFEKHK